MTHTYSSRYVKLASYLRVNVIIIVQHRLFNVVEESSSHKIVIDHTLLN